MRHLGLLALLLWATPALADLPQRPGWPVKIDPGSYGAYLLAPLEGVAVVDLDGDRRLEVLRAAGPVLHAWDLDGNPVPGWPVSLNGSGQPPPSLGDVNGDGRLEIVQVARGLRYSDTSFVHVFSLKGEELSGWPKSFPNLILQAVTLADLNLDGAQELLVQVGSWPPRGSLHVLTGSGTVLDERWQRVLDSYPLAPAAAADLDGDGQVEVAHITLGALNVRERRGEPVAGFPRPASPGKEYAGGVVVIDVDPTRPGLELVTAQAPAGSAEACCLGAIDRHGQMLPGFPVMLGGSGALTAPTAGDLDGDGSLELVIGVAGQGIVIIRSDGTTAKTIPTRAEVAASLQLVDLDGDGSLEIIADNNSWDSETRRGYLEAYHGDGRPVGGFPLRPPGATMGSGITFVDLDGDGQLELIAVSTVHAEQPESYVSIWTLAGARSQVRAWPQYGFDSRRTNCLAMPSELPIKTEIAAPPDPVLPSGCGCEVGVAGGRDGWLLLVIAVLAVAWRRGLRRQRTKAGRA